MFADLTGHFESDLMVPLTRVRGSNCKCMLDHFLGNAQEGDGI